MARQQAFAPRRRWHCLASRWRLPVVLVMAECTFLWPPQACAQAQTRAAVTFASSLPAPRFTLPQPFTSLMRDPRGRGFATPLAGAGSVSWRVDGKTATLDQGSVERVLLNWESFDIAEGYTVRFLQDKDPARLVSALNRVWSERPSLILGSLQADREVIIQNSQGVYFGGSARVSAGRFVASTLGVSDAVFNRGLRNVLDASPVFATTAADGRTTNLDSAVTLEAGAEITSAAGGDVLLVAPRVVNRGRIETPGGQTVLAAGDKVYLMSSSDPAQRGLIVAVDPIRVGGAGATDGAVDTTLGLAENGASGASAAGLVQRLNEIRAESGSVNLVGFSVRQNGQINATTAVKGANGAIFLQAMASTIALDASGPTGAASRGLQIESGSRVRVAAELGSVELGAGSVTAVLPSQSAATQLDAEVFNPSLVRIDGSSIRVGAGAKMLAPAGRIDLRAARSAEGDPLFEPVGGTGAADGSRISIDAGATLSTAGLQGVAVDGARYQGEQRLFRIELADAPVQRSGPLYRSNVFFDLREASRITLGNVTGSLEALGRTASERSTSGGTLSIQTNGALTVADGARLDVSGGSVAVSAATIKNSLVLQDGRLLTFRAATGGNLVDALLASVQQTAVPAFSEGAAGGLLTLSGRQMQLDGQLRGQVEQGERQRDGRSVAAAPASLRIGRRDGSTYDIATLELRPEPPLLRTPQLEPMDGLVLSLPQVAAGGFGSLALRAAQVTQPGGGSLDLGPRGTLDIEARTVSLNGSFRASGGRISVQTPTAAGDADSTRDGDIGLSSQTRLDAAGLWTNDLPSAAAAGTAPVQTAGGSVEVRSAHSLFVQPGAVVDVSGGAWLAATGRLTRGAAGSVTLATGSNPLLSPELQIAGLSLRAFDFDKGGRLTMSGPSLTLADGPTSGPQMGPGLFTDAGFGSLVLTALGDIRVASGLHLAPSLLNWQLTAGHRNQTSGAMSAAVATPMAVDTRLAERQPVSVSLSAVRPLASGGGSVLVERGADIALEPGGLLSLSATRNVAIAAAGGVEGQTSTLSAPGGAIQAAITGRRGSVSSDDPDGFLPDQAIWLGSGARLAVDGVAVLRRDTATAGQLQFNDGSGAATPPEQRQIGKVLGGGSITLNAARGYVLAEVGARLSLDGASAALNVPGLAASVRVARSAGSLVVSSPEGVVLDAQVSAQPPRGPDGQALADGGQLSIALGVGGVLTTTENPQNPYPTAPRVVSVGQHAGLLQRSGTSFGSDLAASLGNGTAYVDAGLLQGAGFAGLNLAAGDLIRFDSSLTAAVPLGLTLNAPAVAAAPGRRVAFSAQAAQLGDTSLARRGAAADTSARADTSPLADTRLTITAPAIEVVGNLGLQGFSSVTLDAAALPAGASASSGGGGGEIRWSAAAPNFGRLESLYRSLQFAGELQLRAAQTYATTATQYSVVGLAGSQVVLRPGHSTAEAPAAAPPLSAFGSLSITASEIDQGGILRQPFGRITLTADTLRLGESSVTSVAGNGASVLFGQTLNLAEWLLPGGDQFFDPAREKAIVLNAGRLVTAASARVQASGGGQVLASEFFPGVGGSRDFTLAAGTYAVLPDYAAVAAQAPDGGSPGAAGSGRQLVVTMPGSGLPPGRYTLMPARQALLSGALPQGAFLVSRAADQGTSVLRAPLLQDDGSVVVTGFISQAGSVAGGTPGERFTVEPASSFNARSDQRLSNVSALLVARAAAQGSASPPLPRDGGNIQISSSGSNRSLWQAQVDLAAGDGGQAGRLDLSASSVALVDDLGKTPAGALGIAAAVVDNSGAGSVLLGGKRSRSNLAGANGTPAWILDTTGTDAVLLDLGARPLVVEELLLGSANSVVLAAGSQVFASRRATQGARTLELSGDGALAAFSANALQVVRDAAAGAGSSAGRLSIGAGSLLSGTQLALDSTGLLQFAEAVQLEAPALALGARRTVVGALAVADPQATVLDGSLLQALRQASDLSLRGYASLDFVGTQDWARRDAASGLPTAVQRQVVLDTPLLSGLPGTDGQPARVDIAAQDLVLRNTTGQTAPAATGDDRGSGVLLLQALPPLRYGTTGGLSIGPGPMQLAFDTATLRSGGDLLLQGRAGSALAALGDLTLAAARVTAASGAQQSLAAGGTLRVAREPGSRTLGEAVGQGADVALQATTIAQDGVIDLPGGRLTLHAAGSAPDAVAMRFGAGSLTSVAGFRLSAGDGFVAYGAAGSLLAAAGQGRIAVQGTLDVSAARQADGSPGEGDAGSLTLTASGPGGALQLTPGQAGLLGRAGSGSTDRGGSLQVDLSTLPSADALAAAARAGGMTGEFGLRVRRGDVALDGGVQAQRVQIAADGGSLLIGAGGAAVQIDASAPAGGSVQLVAGSDFVLGANARVDARSLRAGANGGEVLLGSGAGQLRLSPSATIDASGDDAQDGSIVLRAMRTADNRDIRLDRIDSTRLIAGDVSVEAVRVFNNVATLARNDDGEPSTLSQAALRADAQAFMAAKPAVLQRLGVTEAESAGGRVSLRAGVELRSSGDMRVADDWNLAGTLANPGLDRPGGDAGVLTLRAAGSLLVSGSLSDGFSGLAAAAALNGNARSWSFRLAAGADLTAAHPVAVLDANAVAAGQGDLVIEGGRVLRTGAGSITLAAARDVVFADDGSGSGPGLAYVAGRRPGADRAPAASLFAGQGAKPVFSEQGGRLEVAAGRDVLAPEATQLIGNWFWRSGLASTRAGEAGLYAQDSQLAWWAEPGRFQQVLGSFGGGSLLVRAGRDVLNLQAMVPSAGWVDSRSLAAAASGGLHVINGGDLDVQAGRDLLGGQFFLGRGEGRLLAGRSIGEAQGNAQLRAPILALQDGTWRLGARDGLTVTNAFNPTAVPTWTEDNRPGRSGTFYTWGSDAGVRLWANAGHLAVRAGITDSQGLALGLDIEFASEAAFSVQPASLQATAASGDIDLLFGDGLPLSVLFPSASGQLRLWSGGSILLGGAARGGQLVMAGNDPASWPQAGSPARRDPSPITDVTNGLLTGLLNDSLPLTSLHAADVEPVRLHAQRNLEIRGSDGANTTLAVPKPASLSAGDDVLELSLRAQNLSAQDVTTVSAGRNLLAGLRGRLELAGPGTLAISAGTNIDLGASAGVETSGNLRNPALPAQGASVRLAAAGAARIDLAVLQADFLGAADGSVPLPGGSARQQRAQALLLAFVRDALQSPQLDLATAWQLFKTFPVAAQAALGQQVLAAEFGAVYLAGATPTASEFEASLQSTFERHRSDLVTAAQAALAQNRALLLPGRELVQGQALADYAAALQALNYAQLDLQAVIAPRLASLQAVRSGWRERVASDLGSTAAVLDALTASAPGDARVLAYQAALAERSGRRFEAYRNQVLAAEIGSAAAAASNFGRLALPMRLALFDQGFAVAELAGVGSFEASPGWTAAAPLLRFDGRLDMTSSSVVTRRGGDIALLNPGGGVGVGLKDTGSDSASAPKGVIALGGGNVFGYAKDDFQVNTQRVFVVGTGDLTIWSSRGDIDSGRGANTAVAAPPLAPRRAADGVLFEVPATTTGSGLGILADAQGRRSGTIGLFPALGEILALDAFIRAPAVVLGSTVKGADNLLSASVGGAAAAVAAPPPAVVAAAPSAQARGAAAAADATAVATRQRDGLLTVELLGLGLPSDELCDEKNKDDDKCKRPAR
jgi:filamentous hemagglutinin family protein